MSDRDIIKKLASIVIKQQKIQNKILQKLGVDTGMADEALKKLALEITNKCRCNNCMRIYQEDIDICPICNTDSYLMQPFVPSEFDIDTTILKEDIK